MAHAPTREHAPEEWGTGAMPVPLRSTLPAGATKAGNAAYRWGQDLAVRPPGFAPLTGATMSATQPTSV
jgi:hypothetical protein